MVAQRQGESDVPTLKLVIESLGVQLNARDFDTSVSAYLGGVYVQHMLFKGQVTAAAAAAAVTSSLQFIACSCFSVP